MLSKLQITGLTCLLFLGCTQSKPFRVVYPNNPGFIKNTVFSSFENLSDPKFQSLKSNYQLDTIFHSETNEFKRILLLRNWIRQHIKINDEGPYPGDGSCESILAYAFKGNGFHCGHFMVVQNAILNAYGYVTRCLGAGPGGTDGEDWHHGINEVWLNDYHKWFLSDAKYNSHFEKNGVPLSALEVRDEYLKNKAADIVRVKGVERMPVHFDEEFNMEKKEFARTYSWVEWDLYNDRYTNWPIDSANLIMYNDSYFKTHTWVWDGKPHWAYNTPFMRLVSDRHAIEWTPNTISSKVLINGNNAKINLTSATPNLETYQMRKLPAGEWENIPDTIDINLMKDKYEIIFRAENLAGVTGPEHKIIIVR